MAVWRLTYWRNISPQASTIPSVLLGGWHSIQSKRREGPGGIKLFACFLCLNLHHRLLPQGNLPKTKKLPDIPKSKHSRGHWLLYQKGWSLSVFTHRYVCSFSRRENSFVRSPSDSLRAEPGSERLLLLKGWVRLNRVIIMMPRVAFDNKKVCPFY